MPHTVAVYFVASPLQYLAARRIAKRFESGSRQVLVWYKRSVAAVVRPEEWDASAYMAWPRFEPLPGFFGAHRRLLANLRQIADLAGSCEELHIHSAVFDSEVINYFLRALPRLCAAPTMRARILPDGVISIRRYPLGAVKRLLQRARRLRRLFSPQLDYWCFSGDRIGSDAPFCDRIYVLPGLPNEYPAHKVTVLPPLVDQPSDQLQNGAGRALVIGQPLVGFALMSRSDCDRVTAEIRVWLAQRNVTGVDYKGHPKDHDRDLMHQDYRPLEITEPLESYMSHHPYDFVIGVRSTALLLARQIYGPRTQVVAFGWDRIRFKSEAERADMRKAFTQCGVNFA
jgi:hypothetical protein